MQVGGGEMDAGADAARLEAGHEGFALHPAPLGADAQDVEVPGVGLGVVGQRQGRDRQLGQALGVGLGQQPATAVDVAQAIQLHQGQGGVDVREVVLEAGLLHLGLGLAAQGLAVEGIHRQAVEFQSAYPLGQGGVVGHQHAAFGAGQVLDGVKAEDGGAALADGLALVAGAGGVGGVFDQRHAMLAGQGAQRGQVAAGAGVVHRHDGLGARGDGGGHLLGGDHQGVAVDVDEHRGGADQGDHVGGGDPGQRGGDHLVARADVQRQQGHVHGGGGRAQGHGVGGAHRIGEALFQQVGLGPGGDPARGQHLAHRGHFLGADAGPGKRQEGLVQLARGGALGQIGHGGSSEARGAGTGQPTR